MSDNLEQHWKNLSLTRCGDTREAGLWIVSLPWPRSETSNLYLNGRPTSCLPLGRWPGSVFPRRLLLAADANHLAPGHLHLAEYANDEKAAPELPQAVAEIFDSGDDPAVHREQHRLVIRHGGRSIALALGLRTGGEVHWWEACRLVELHRSPDCVVVEMGGAIEVRNMTKAELEEHRGYTNPFLHKHNWLNGNIYARLHSNGVCEVYAHHINSRFFDSGRDLEDVVPVIGFCCDPTGTELDDCLGPWDGTVSELEFGGIRLDLTESARFATPAQPGNMTRENGILIWQPYLGVELYGGDPPEEMTGDPYIFRAEKQMFPRGMARTLRFSLSLSDRPPNVVRYLPSAEWFENCGEFFTGLQTLDEKDDSWEEARQWTRRHIMRGGFEDGLLPRQVRSGKTDGTCVRHMPGWEGELPYAQFLTAWRTGDGEDHAVAMRAAYFITDVIVDHSSKLVRMHSYPPPAISLPMHRMQGTIAAYLETGDPYLIETAEAVTANAFWLHKNSWPRMAVGRDACFVRSAVLLYRYTGEEFFRRIAFEGCMSVVESQRDNGSFGDQGGGSGIHQQGGYISKPWMGLLALNGVLDYLELFPDEERFRQAVKRFADWLMAERQIRKGVRTWCYQHDFNGRRDYFDHYSGKQIELPSRGTSWHHETLARLLGYATAEFRDPSYIEAWKESRSVADPASNDHSVAAVLQFLKPASNNIS